MDTTKETEIRVKPIQKILFIVAVFLIVFFIGRRLIRSFYGKYAENPVIAVLLGIDSPSKTSDQNLSQPMFQQSNNNYNFRRLIHLIEESLEVKRRFYASYLEHTKARTYVDTDAMKELLSELYREKMRLDNYIFYVKKAKTQAIFTDKRERSLGYFKKVLLKNIKEIEIILKKI